MLQISKHKTALVRILKEIYTHTALGPLLGFKGGTAVYLFYNLPRFSTDLDFDLLDSGQEGFVFEQIGKVIENFGTVKDKRNKRNTLFYLLSYEGEQQNIKVEISKRSLGSAYELKNYLGVPVLLMEKGDIFANKIVALTQRKELANRDLFDLWFFLKNNWEINEELVKARTGLPLKNYLAECLKLAEGVSQKTILSGMGELLDEKLKVWAKNKLKDDLIFLLKLRMETLPI